MDITEVRIKLTDDPGDRLKAFCSITFDGCFVIRDLKIIDGPNGPFVAMPSRKLTAHCPRCRVKNHIKANYCNQCGAKLDLSNQQHRFEVGRSKLYADIAHPINSQCREQIQNAVLKSFEEEKIKALAPNYVSSYDDYNEDFDYEQGATPLPDVHIDRSHKLHGPHVKPQAPIMNSDDLRQNDYDDSQDLP